MQDVRHVTESNRRVPLFAALLCQVEQGLKCVLGCFELASLLLTPALHEPIPTKARVVSFRSVIRGPRLSLSQHYVGRIAVPASHPRVGSLSHKPPR